ncbi:conserved hypothetical protein [Gammaproteobacteria bacterium]
MYTLSAYRPLLLYLLVSLLPWRTIDAGVLKDLPYPQAVLTAEEVAAQVYFVNHFYAVRNYSIQQEGNIITLVIKRASGESPTTETVERYLNNDYNDGEVKAKDLAIFRSGRLRATAMLVTDYIDDNKTQAYAIWLPALRKVRRFAQPSFDDAWGGTDFTFEDVTLRKPSHETHMLLGQEIFDTCLSIMNIPPDQQNKYMTELPQPSCAARGRTVYKLKSNTRFQNWWYDYRISYIDSKTFGDYRTEIFKDGEKIRVIDRDWGSMDLPDPRALTWRYWYGKNLKTGHETWAIIPTAVNHWNTEINPMLWTENTLQKLDR